MRHTSPTRLSKVDDRRVTLNHGVLYISMTWTNWIYYWMRTHVSRCVDECVCQSVAAEFVGLWSDSRLRFFIIRRRVCDEDSICLAAERERETAA